jgi:hypothetical protein
MDVIKKSYHPLRIRNKQNGVVGVYGNWTMNIPVLIFHTGIWLSRETRKYHVLKVSRPYNFWDVWRFEILPNHHVIPAWKFSFFHIFFGNIYGTN